MRETIPDSVLPLEEKYEFLAGREGASTSDVYSLMQKFKMSENDAVFVYRSWLDTLV